MFHTHDLNYIQIQPGNQLPGTLIVGSTYSPHQHTHTCIHNLAYCSVCDAVYCTICGKEWGQPYRWYPCTWQPYTGITYNNLPGLTYT